MQIKSFVAINLISRTADTIGDKDSDSIQTTMDSIDPELRGAAAAAVAEEEDAKQPEAQVTKTSVDIYIYPTEQQRRQEQQQQQAIDANRNELERVSQQVSQSLATEGLPYFSGPLADPTTAAPSTYQPLNFTPHEARRRPRSCESCRGLKVKCEPTIEGSCKRCVKAGRECLYTESSGRRKKKQDNKVAELEKKVSGLTAALLAQRGAETSDGLAFEESIISQHTSPKIEPLNGKRKRTEIEEDYNQSPIPAAKHQFMSSGSPEVRAQAIHTTQLHSLANESITKEFCATLKSLDAWVSQHIKSSNSEISSSRRDSGANGTSSKIESDSPTDATAASKKNAPTAPMGRTPLDLLSQVASNEKPSSSSSNQNQWYSPYANASQDTSGYYNQKNHEGNNSSVSNVDSHDLDQLLRREFAERGSLVMNFLSSFLLGSSVP